MGWMGTRFYCALLAVFAGWVVYLLEILAAIYMIPGFYHPLMILGQPVMALIISVSTTGLALLTGLLLKIPWVNKRWTGSARWAKGLLITGLFLLWGGGSLLGFNQTNSFEAIPGHTVTYQWLRTDVACICYFVLIFSIANWPIIRRKS